jgi:predicted phage tail protein
LDWLAVNGATSYNVHYGLSSGIYDRLIPDARAPFVHLGLANNQPYYYIVTAVNSFGESGYPNSGEVSATPVFPTGNPLPPVSLTIASVSGQNTLTWDAVPDAASYNIYWSNTPITPNKYSADNVIRGVTSPFIHTNLTDGLSYCYIITALNSNGESADSIQACGGIGAIQIIW